MIKKVVIILLMSLTMTGCGAISSNPFKKAQKPAPVDLFYEMRNKILSLNPGDVGIKPSTEMPDVWGILMETGYPEGVATLVSLADGTTSLYFNNGGGILGTGGHAAVAQSSKAFVVEAERFYQKMTLTESFPLPKVGRVKFYVLTYMGIYTIDIDKNEFRNGKHEFSPLFYKGQDVVTQVMQVQPK